jgi:dTDP-4-amino-4,6-dideoxygalactose transaminase
MAKGWESRIEEFKRIRLNNAKEIAAYGVVLPGLSNASIPNLIRFPVLTKDAGAKSRILKKSERMGLGISDGYPGSINGIEELEILFGRKGFPAANDIAERLISLPMHTSVSKSDIRNIVQLLRNQS